MTKDVIQTQRRVTEEEALRNARELIAEEELEKKREEKKRTKRKKKKEKKKLKEKERKEQEVIVEKIKIDPEPPESPPTTMPTTLIRIHNKENSNPNKNTDTSQHNGHKCVLNHTVDNSSTKKNKINEQKNSNNNSSKLKTDSTNNKKDSCASDKKSKLNRNAEQEVDEDAIDTNSAFFQRAASRAPTTTNQSTALPPSEKEPPKDMKKKKKSNNNTNTDKAGQAKKTKTKQTMVNNAPSSNDNTSTNEDATNEDSSSFQVVGAPSIKSTQVDNEHVILQSRQIAVKGNQMAQNHDYKGAVSMFTKAIQLDPNDFRFFGNRSYCYDRIEQFENALCDGDAAIKLAPEWPKGYFRKGRALTGLKRFQEAEQVFQQVLKLDPVCEDAQFELARVRVQILMDMGFAQPLSEQAVRTYGTVQQALEALLAGKVSDEEGSEETCISEEEEEEEAEEYITDYVQNKKVKRNIKPPEPKCTALWVGNVDPSLVTEKHMNQLFSKCGKVASVRILPHKYCAFVNFNDSAGASAAMDKLQGAGLGNQKLLLRFPNNPPPGSFIPEPATTVQPNNKIKPSSVSESSNDSSKVSGSVNGNECYFWRTTGCVFENKCRFKHVRGHKGVDLSKVHAKYGKIAT